MPIQVSIPDERIPITVDPDLTPDERLHITADPRLMDFELLDMEFLCVECPAPDSIWTDTEFLAGPMLIELEINAVRMETIDGDYVDEFSSLIFEAMDLGIANMYDMYANFIADLWVEAHRAVQRRKQRVN